MIVGNMVLVILFCVVEPLLLGACIRKFVYNSNKITVSSYILGYSIMLGIYELFVIPFYFLKLSLWSLTLCWQSILIVIIVLGLFFFRKEIKINISFIKKINGIEVILLVIIVLQIVFITLYQHSDLDDSWFLGMASSSYYTNTINYYDPYTGYVQIPQVSYIFSPFPVFIASMAQVTGIHPLIFAHSIWPIFAIIMYYGVVHVFGASIFNRNRKKINYFMLFMILLSMMGNYSRWSQSTFLFFRSWQGKAMVCAILLPMLFLYLNRFRKVRELLIIYATVFAGCLSSSMAIILFPVLTVCVTIAGLLSERNWKKAIQRFSACIIPIFLGMLRMIIF